MRKIRVSLGEGGKVSIKLGGKKEKPPPIEDQLPASGDILTFRPSIINLMEIRAESVFRPNQGDVEVIYALSGSNPSLPDMLHKFSSNQVIHDATAESISYLAEDMIGHLKEERDDQPRLIVKIHTHPRGTPHLSEADKKSNKHVADIIRKHFHEVKILFGVHAVSGEERRSRSDPVKTTKNRIRWTSITREHEVAFYTADGRPYEVRVVE